MLVTDFLAQYILEHDLRESSIVTMRYTVSAFESWLGRPATLDDFNQETLNKHLVWMQSQQRAAATINGRKKNLLTLWRAAWDCELMDQFPRRVRKIKLPRKNPLAWTPEEVRQLVVTAMATPDTLPCRIEKAVWWTSLILTAWDSALRLGDLLAFEYEWIPPGGCLTIMQRKTGFTQQIQLRPVTLEWIDRCMAQGSQRRIIWPRTSRREEFYRSFNRIVRRAGVRSGTFRWLRRASITAVDVLQYGAGTDQAGHRDRGITLRHYVDRTQIPFSRPLPPEVLIPYQH